MADTACSREIKLNDIELDALKEIATMGLASAATALSGMVNNKIDITVPDMKVMDLCDVPDAVGGADTMAVLVHLKITGVVPGNVILLLPIDHALALIDLLYGNPVGTIQALDSDGEAALKETGNVIAGSYITALGNFLGAETSLSVPNIASDMIGAMIDVFLINMSVSMDKAFVITTEFTQNFTKIKGTFMLLMDPSTFDKVLNIVDGKMAEQGNSDGG